MRNSSQSLDAITEEDSTFVSAGVRSPTVSPSSDPHDHMKTSEVKDEDPEDQDSDDDIAVKAELEPEIALEVAASQSLTDNGIGSPGEPDRECCHILT